MLFISCLILMLQVKGQALGESIPGAIKGEIFDHDSLEPLSNASVILLSQVSALSGINRINATDHEIYGLAIKGCESTTNFSGHFEIPSISVSKTNNYSLLITRDGYKSCLIECINIRPGAGMGQSVEIGLIRSMSGITIFKEPPESRRKCISELPERTYRDTHQIYATREGLTGGTTANGHVIKDRDHFVALPSNKSLCKNDSDQGGLYQVQLFYRGRSCIVPVWDIGPWNTKDDYWNAVAAREMWNDLAQFLPEAQAAYQNSYNDGKDGYGRKVSNPAGIDLADGTFWDDLQMNDNDWIEIRYLWQESGMLKGDIDRDGLITSNDAELCLKIILDLPIAYANSPASHTATQDERAAADFNSDGSVFTDDAVLIMKNISSINLTNHAPGRSKT